MIRFENVCFDHGAMQTVKDVSFHIQKGEFAALIGANGAGKTTLCRLCNGLLRPSSGRVLIGGEDTAKTKTSHLARSVGFLFQNPDRQICQNTIRAELRFGLANLLEDSHEIEIRVEQALEQFGFDGGKDPFSLSRGERQRLALASLIACRPEMMILDEPTTGLDYRECMQMMELITSLNGQGTTVLMVSHDMEVVLDFAKRVLVLSDGRLIADGETRETLARQPLLATASVLPPQICALALRLGTGFEGIFTVEEMLPAIEERCR